MSLFTKIFVVLVMLMSVLLVGLVVPFVVNVDTFKSRWVAAMAEAETAKANYKTREADIAATIQGYTSGLEQKEAEIARLQQMISDKDKSLASGQAEVIALQNANTDVRAQLDKLTSAEKLHAEINKMLQEEIKTRRDESLTLVQRNVELTEKLNEETTESEAMQRQVRLFKEQIADLERQNQELASAGGAPTAAPGQAAPTSDLTKGFSPEFPIRGMVADVQTIGDEVFIAINVGSNDGVKEGMKFMIHKGDEYLGDAIIMQVDLNSAAGRVTLQRGTITANEAEVLAGGKP